MKQAAGDAKGCSLAFIGMLGCAKFIVLRATGATTGVGEFRTEKGFCGHDLILAIGFVSSPYRFLGLPNIIL